MARILGRKNSRISLPGAASLLVITMLFAQVLGFLRTMFVNGVFAKDGLGDTDAYFAAFKVPDFFFYILAAGVLSVVLIPVLSDHMSKGDRRGVWKLSSSLMNLLGLITFVLGIFILIFADPLMGIVADLHPEQHRDAVAIMRLIAFNPFFFTLSGILTSAQQVFGRFFVFAITPVVYNAVIIASIFIFGDWLGLVGVGLGAGIAGLVQFLIALAGVKGLGFYYRPKIHFKSPEFRGILKQLPARSLDQGIDSVNSIVETNRASAIGPGVVSAYENAFILHTAPILLVGSSISTAAFPRLTERLSQGRPDLFRKEFIGVLKFLMWIAIPVMVVAFFSRGYLARLIFKRGSPEIALILGFLAVAIFFRIIFTLLTRYFYAYKDSTTPLIISVFAIALNIILVFTLARPEAYGAAGLAIAQSVVAGVEVLILSIVIFQRDPKIFTKDLAQYSLRLVSVTGFTMVTAFIMLQLLPLQLSDVGFFALGTKLGAIVLVVFTVHLFVSAFFGFKEATDFIEKIKKLIISPIKIQ